MFFYLLSVIISTGGLAYAAVPLYQMFCQATGFAGTVNKNHDSSKVATMQAVEDNEITIKFSGSTSSSMPWKFHPQQREVKVVPGETALAFFKASNPTDKPITGISTYNVVPFEAAQYFNKIQCFCFEEQRLNPGEEVDMPVFFYIDPEFSDDPQTFKINEITLSYTFFDAKHPGTQAQLQSAPLPAPHKPAPNPPPTAAAV